MKRTISKALASAFLSGPWRFHELIANGARAVSSNGEWLVTLVLDVMKAFPSPPLHQFEALDAFIFKQHDFTEAWSARRIARAVPRFLAFEPQMGPMRWPVPALATQGALATWLGVTSQELAWFTSRRNERGAAASLGHYIHHWIARDEATPRLVEAPKRRLKALQRKVLDALLVHLPPHQAAHGFVRGRSVATHAALHVGQSMVMRFDLTTFFTSVSAARAHGLFVTLGYPLSVARALLALCTTSTPESVLSAAPFPEPFTLMRANDRHHHLRRLADWHLPQGAPSSPALANLAAYGLDVRLHAYAQSRALRYSRYADDLVFSGDIRSPGAVSDVVSAIAREEGFRVNAQKTRAMPASTRQFVTGVVVNEHTNFARDDFDRLKARLHRCATTGPRTAELRAELLGVISWVRTISPARSVKLMRLFERISWD